MLSVYMVVFISSRWEVHQIYQDRMNVASVLTEGPAERGNEYLSVLAKTSATPVTVSEIQVWPSQFGDMGVH